MQPIIKIENLSKMYRLGVIGTGTISHDINRWWHKVRGKEDPYLKIGEANVSDRKRDSGYVWALKDINLEVMPGEVLGIIGKNGAGKSTLLKILSKVTGPTTGKITYRGRIGSLLEVGTGFHGELTGRENIFLNGAILGMTKAEIRSKLDEIVDFAGIERYIDTPVKRYSSGMKVRLGFAVAAHLEPEILVVDEVLAVGDAEFQKKAIGKMQDISANKGRTILFVSHNMESIENLCTKLICLHDSTIQFEGNVTEGINYYLHSEHYATAIKEWSKENYPHNNYLELHKAKVTNANNKINNRFDCNEDIFIHIKYRQLSNELLITAIIQIVDDRNNIVLSSSEFNNDNWKSLHESVNKGLFKTTCVIPRNFLAEGKYYINIAFRTYYPDVNHLTKNNILSFSVFDDGIDKTAKGFYKGKWPGITMPLLDWNVRIIK